MRKRVGRGAKDSASLGHTSVARVPVCEGRVVFLHSFMRYYDMLVHRLYTPREVRWFIHNEMVQ